MRNVRRRQVEQTRKQRKIVFLTIGILLSVYLTFSLVVGENGFLRYGNVLSSRSRSLNRGWMSLISRFS